MENDLYIDKINEWLGLSDEKTQDCVHSKDSVSQLGNASHTSTSASFKLKLAELKIEYESQKNIQGERESIEQEELELKQSFERRQLKFKLQKEALQSRYREEVIERMKEEVNRSQFSANNTTTRFKDEKLPNYRTKTQTQPLQANEIALSLLQAQTASKLPHNEPEKFSGQDITRYKTFILSFDRVIGQKCPSNDDKLYYLLNYTTGEDNKLVQSCHHMNLDVGYKEALRLLDDMYGNEYQIANKYLEKFINWEPIKSEDRIALRELSAFLICCRNMMSQMTSLNQLNSWRDIKEIVIKLPWDMRKQFRATVTRLSSNNETINFHTLVSFVKYQSDVLNFPLLGDISDRRTEW